LKIAIITDTHFGAKGDSQIFLEHTFKFFEDVFFPTIKEQGITNVLHLGDLMDRLKKSTFTVLSAITILTSKTQTKSTLPKSCLVISIQTFTSILIL
jgi:DNA repair exonuclease SbcCD nuclease subunit